MRKFVPCYGNGWWVLVIFIGILVRVLHRQIWGGIGIKGWTVPLSSLRWSGPPQARTGSAKHWCAVPLRRSPSFLVRTVQRGRGQRVRSSSVRSGRPAQPPSDDRRRLHLTLLKVWSTTSMARDLNSERALPVASRCRGRPRWHEHTTRSPQEAPFLLPSHLGLKTSDAPRAAVGAAMDTGNVRHATAACLIRRQGRRGC